MKVLILGAGLAGAPIKKALEQQGHTVFGTYHTPREQHRGDHGMLPYHLGDEPRLNALLRGIGPELVISCLRGDFSLQLQAHRTVAGYLKGGNGKLMFLSTANVFDGALDRPHYEGDKPQSSTDYRQFKIACEALIQDALGDNSLILRLPQIWGKDCPRLAGLKRDIADRTPIPTYRNLYVNCVTNRQIAEWAAYIVEHGLTGIFHVGTQDLREYITLQQELTAAMGLGQPVFSVEEPAQRQFQAVLPGRPDIPASLQSTVKDVIQYMVDTQ